MATIDPNQDYDIIHTLTFAEASGDCPIRLHRGSSSTYTGTVYYRAGTSGSWTSLSVSGTATTFPITSTTMQVGHYWNKSAGNDYMTPSFRDATNITSIAISQKSALTGAMGNYFMYSYARGCSGLTSLDIPDVSGLTSVGSYFMAYYAFGCSSLTSLDVPDTSSLESVGTSFMHYYAYGCSFLTSLDVPDTSGLESVGNYFMAYYAYGCSSLTSLDVPDTSGLESVGDYFMYYYAYNCSSLTELVLPAVGWFKDNNVDWRVPSGRLGILKGRVLDSDDLSDWKALTAEGKTLYTNYIRDPDLVDITAGGGEAIVKVSAEGGFAVIAAGGGEAIVKVSAEGGFAVIAAGGGEAIVKVSAEGGFAVIAAGGGEAIVKVSAEGGFAVIGIEWVPLGVFWSGDWDVPDDSLYAHTTGRDRLELLRYSTYEPVSDFANIDNLYDLAVDVFQSAGLTEAEYWIDSELEQFGTAYVYLGSSSHREALRLIAEACAGQVYCDREGVIRVEGPSFAKSSVSEEAYIITPDDYFTKNNYVKWGEMANHVEVQTLPLRPSWNEYEPAWDEKEVYRSNEAVQIEADQEIAINALYNIAPCIAARARLESADEGIEIVKEDYYADRAEIVVHSTVDGSFELVITAVPLEIKGRELIVIQDDASIKEHGLIKFVFPENPLVQRIAAAEMVAQHILSLYKDPRQNIDLDWRGNPALELGDVIKVLTSQQGDPDEQDRFVITRQEIEYSGGLRAKLSGYKITGDGE